VAEDQIAVVETPTAPVVTRAQEKWLYRPSSWFERLDLMAMFGRRAPLAVELGSGDGSFLVNWAGRFPDRDFVGVERLLGRIRKLDRKAQRAGLTNVRGLRIEASYCLEYLLPAGSVEALHVYFPDPWPKRRHHKNRLVNARFAELTRVALAPGGVIHLRTDDASYFEQMLGVFAQAEGFEAVETPADLAGVVTDFERDFNAQGILTRRASYRRSG
jgi:tRNA (guanine-N7-)-methyltransferase